MIEINNVTKYLEKHKDTPDLQRIVSIIENVVIYLLVYDITPEHYTMGIVDKVHGYVFINIDQEYGYIEKQVWKSKFEFIAGTRFELDFDMLPNIEECKKLKERLEMKKKDLFTQKFESN